MIFVLVFQVCCTSSPKVEKRNNELMKVDYNLLKEINKELLENKVTEKIIALTFDDGPHPTITEKILDILHKNNVVATFFVLGEKADDEENIVKSIVEEGHEVGSHGYGHPQFNKIPKASVEHDICDALNITKQYVSDIRWFRPPYGIITKDLKKILKKNNLNLSLWNIDGQDWKKKGPDFIFSRIKSEYKNGGIILLHDIHEDTATILPEIIKFLKEKGYKFKTLSQWKEFIRKNAPKAFKKSFIR
jgi:peptidoglycan/xylan/chitin deacetylase (PgdA/CDA1 family)